MQRASAPLTGFAMQLNAKQQNASQVYISQFPIVQQSLFVILVPASASDSVRLSFKLGNIEICQRGKYEIVEGIEWEAHLVKACTPAGHLPAP
jgi:hypothetical protein